MTLGKEETLQNITTCLVGDRAGVSICVGVNDIFVKVNSIMIWLDLKKTWFKRIFTQMDSSVR